MSNTRKARFASPLLRTESHVDLTGFEDFENVPPNSNEPRARSPSSDDVGNTSVYVDPRDLPTESSSPAATEWQGPSSQIPDSRPTPEQMSAYWQALHGELGWLRERICKEERVWSNVVLTLETIRERTSALAPFHKRYTDLLA